MPDIVLRDFQPADTDALDAVASAAFRALLSNYADPSAMAVRVSHMSSLAAHGRLTVASIDGGMAGGVVYVPAYGEKPSFFEPHWPIIRMLVVAPGCQGRGVGRTLTEHCIALARSDGASTIALHTTPVMAAALKLYLALGFKKHCDAPPILSVPYAVYLKDLGAS